MREQDCEKDQKKRIGLDEEKNRKKIINSELQLPSAFVKLYQVIKDKKRSQYILWFLFAGVILLCYGNIQKSVSSRKENSVKNTTEQTTQRGLEEKNNDFRKEMEEELIDLLEKIEGKGNVAAMITLKETKEVVLAKNINTSKEVREELDQSGAKENTIIENMQEEYAMIEKNQEQEPVIIKEYYPKIAGVLIVIKDDSAAKKLEITEAVQALFGIDTHMIKVLRMGS